MWHFQNRIVALWTKRQTDLFRQLDTLPAVPPSDAIRRRRLDWLSAKAGGRARARLGPDRSALGEGSNEDDAVAIFGNLGVVGQKARRLSRRLCDQ